MEFVCHLVRHGETNYNANGLLQGSSIDAELNATGRSQAEKLSRAMADISPDAILYSSPLIRALETGIISTGRTMDEFLLDDRLKEVTFGKWDGKSREELSKRMKELKASTPHDLTGDGVEKPEQTQKRAKDFLEDMTKATKTNGKPVIIFAHGAFNRQFVNHLKSRNAKIPDHV